MEWEVEVDSWNEDNAHGNTKYADALASALKLPTMSGFRYYNDANVSHEGYRAAYWSASVSGTKARFLYFFSDAIDSDLSTNRAFGHTVRCIKDQ